MCVSYVGFFYGELQAQELGIGAARYAPTALTKKVADAANHLDVAERRTSF